MQIPVETREVGKAAVASEGGGPAGFIRLSDNLAASKIFADVQIFPWALHADNLSLCNRLVAGTTFPTRLAAKFAVNCGRANDELSPAMT